MRKVRLAVVLPIVQFAAAAILLQWARRVPVPPGSAFYVPNVRLICDGLNAPALLFGALAIFGSYTSSFLGFPTSDLLFLVGVIIVWYIVGRVLDRRRNSKAAPQRGIATALVMYPLLLMLGSLLLFLGVYGLGPHRPNIADPPVGAFLTLMWSGTLIFLSGRGLVRAIRPAPRRVKRGLLVAGFALTILIVAGLWIGGPFGATQALGEYLHPTTVEMMPLPDGCVPTNETPPANLMRIVEHQKNVYHLALQKVIVCRTARKFPHIEPDFTEAAFSKETRKRWLPLYLGCCSYQFRRHVAVVVFDSNESGSIMVEAALIQSRWDYLRLNWLRYQGAWF